MGAEGAVEIVYRKELEAAEDKAAERQKRITEYRDFFSSPYVSASRRMVDDIIEPNQTRIALARALEVLSTKRDLRPQKKHGLIPL
jgi:methylmalonyl-CoA carboxyltransferase large subunit